MNPKQNKPKESHAKICHNQLSKNFYDVEGYHKESEKATLQNGEKILANHISDNSLVFRIYKVL